MISFLSIAGAFSLSLSILWHDHVLSFRGCYAQDAQDATLMMMMPFSASRNNACIGLRAHCSRAAPEGSGLPPGGDLEFEAMADD